MLQDKESLGKRIFRTKLAVTNSIGAGVPNCFREVVQKTNAAVVEEILSLLDQEKEEGQQQQKKRQGKKRSRAEKVRIYRY